MARSSQRRDVPAHEVDGVAATELLPRERAVLAGGAQLLTEHRDRPLATLVDVRESPSLGPARVPRVDGDAARLELLARAVAEVVVGEHGEEEA